MSEERRQNFCRAVPLNFSAEEVEAHVCLAQTELCLRADLAHITSSLRRDFCRRNGSH